MSLGIPVVCISAMGVQDMMSAQRGGFALDENVAEFTEKVLLLLSDTRVYQIKRAEALEFVKGWDVDAMCRKLIGVYEGLIRDRG